MLKFCLKERTYESLNETKFRHNYTACRYCIDKEVIDFYLFLQ